MPQDKQEQLDNLFESFAGCAKCRMDSSRKSIVFGDGSTNSETMVVGEAPGKDEDACGLPFQGDSGQRLNNILLPLAGLTRKDVYVTNVCKCRPTNENDKDRPPNKSERDNCHEIFQKELEIVRPKTIILLGAQALRAIFGEGATLKETHGKIHRLNGWFYFPTYHPSKKNNRYFSQQEEDFSKLKILV